MYNYYLWDNKWINQLLQILQSGRLVNMRRRRQFELGGELGEMRRMGLFVSAEKDFGLFFKGFFDSTL